MRRMLQLGTAVSLLALAIGTRPAVASTAGSLGAYFPSSSQYPAGYTLTPIKTYRDPAAVLGDVNARLARGLHFAVGSERTGFGRGTVLTIAVARFQTAWGAGQFGLHFQNSIKDDSLKKTRLVAGVGASQARYVSGNCAACGKGSPPLGQMYFSRGPMFVLLGIQPANLGMVRQLGIVIDAKLKVAHLR